MVRSLDERNRESEKFTWIAGILFASALTVVVGGTLFMSADLVLGTGLWPVWVIAYVGGGLLAYAGYRYAQASAYVPE